MPHSPHVARVSSLAQITYEKEHGLEMMMIMMGLGNSTNLIVLYLFYYTMYVLYILVFLIAGIAIGWNFFTGNSYGEWRFASDPDESHLNYF